MTTTRLSGSTSPGFPLDPDPGFDATFGHSLADLLTRGAPPDEPADLASFWAEVAAETSAVDPDPAVGAWSAHPESADHELADLTYRSLDGFAVGGWIARPRAGADRLVVAGHGYGGRGDPGLADLPADALVVYPVARGLPDRSLVPGIGTGDDERDLPHVLWGIEEPRRYSHVGSVADYWLAAVVGAELLPHRAATVFHGGSFGGGIGALALGWGADAPVRFDAAVLEVPSFGDYPWRVANRCTGSGRFVTQHLRRHPEAIRTLRYVDAASAATRVRVPVLALPALADPAVPPPSQFSVANSLAGPTWLHVLPWGHCEWLGLEDELAARSAAVAEFWADPAAATAVRR